MNKMTTNLSLFENDVISFMREEIIKANGNEVFFVGKSERENHITDVTVIARGNENEVPVIYDQAFRGDYVIHNHPSGTLKPSENDLAIASYLGNQGIGFLIINNSVTESYVVVEGVKETEKELLDIDDLSSLIDQGGRIVKYFDRFEKRESQIKMLRLICEAFNHDKIALIEAGTGIGKSMAYLIPSIYWSLQNKEKVVISTNTINLQEQLCKKDIPFLQKALDLQFKAVLVKGRANYICLRKLHSGKDDTENELFENQEQTWIQGVLDAIDTLKEGTKDELSGIIPLEGWDKISSDTDTCLKGKCAFFSQCFFFKARKEVNKANIVIVNHHLLCSDIAIKAETGDAASSYGLLPPYQKAIIDEAHNLERVAINYLGHTVSQFSFKQAVSRIYQLKGSTEKGILPILKRKILTKKEEGDYEIFDELFGIMTDKVIPDILILNPLIDNFFQFILEYTVEKLQKKPLETTLRIIPDTLPASIKNKLDKESNALIQGSSRSYDRLTHLVSKLNEIPFHIKEELSGLIQDLKAYSHRLFSAMMSLETFVHFKETDSVYWLELRKKNNFTWVRLNVSPLDVSKLLYDYFFSSKETVILTSATLAIDNNFQFIMKQIGLTQIPSKKRIESILSSPFDFKKQMSICIPTDLLNPMDRNFNISVNKLLTEILNITKGKTFILFTSYGMLNQTYDYLLEYFNHTINLLKQGSIDRHTLINRFRNGNQSVLLGTDSFWEGVDVPGDALKCVILVKLPFRVPTEPINQGKMEKLEKEGRNPFYEYSLPQSVIKFRQGFGRLIRTKEDRGVIICLDKRIITKSYGKIFINSLPPCNQVVGDSIKVIKEVSDYF